MRTQLLASTEQKMTRSIDAMERDFQKVRIGGASAALVDAIYVDHRGRRSRLIELADITVPDPRQILIRPWEPTALRAIGTAISQSRIGLTPTIDGSAIRLYVPAMTEECRLELAGLVRKRMDQTRVEIRTLRHEALAAVRAGDRERPAGEDDVRRETTFSSEWPTDSPPRSTASGGSRRRACFACEPAARRAGALSSARATGTATMPAVKGPGRR